MVTIAIQNSTDVCFDWVLMMRCVAPTQRARGTATLLLIMIMVSCFMLKCHRVMRANAPLDRSLQKPRYSLWLLAYHVKHTYILVTCRTVQLCSSTKWLGEMIIKMGCRHLCACFPADGKLIVPGDTHPSENNCMRNGVKALPLAWKQGCKGTHHATF